jgi:uncharacterized membrane protein YbhN (UPF0104 family)
VVLPFFGMTLVGLFVVVGVAFGGLRIFTDVDPASFFQRVELPWLAMAVGLFVFGNLLVGHRFMALYPSDRSDVPGPFQIGAIFFSGNVFTLLLPGPVGELAAIAVLKKRFHMPMNESFVVSVHTRFVGLFSAAVVAALALPFVRPEGVLGQVLLVAGIVMIIGGVSFGLLAAQPVWLRRFGQWMLSLMSPDSTGPLGWFLKRSGPNLRLFVESLTRVWNVSFSRWIQVVIWSLVIQSIQFCSLVCATYAISIHPQWPGLLLSQGMGSLTVLLAFVIPGGLGAYELAVISSLAGPGGLVLVDAGMAALCFRVVQLLGLACAGVCFLGLAKGFLSPEIAVSMRQGWIGSDE